MTDKEKSLLAGCLRGDKASWDAFVLEYSKLVYHTIRSTFKRYHADPESEAVGDLHQEVFLSLVGNNYRKLRQFRGDGGCSLASWLRLITSRITIDFLRKPNHPATDVGDNFPGVSDDSGSLDDNDEEQNQVISLLEKMLPRDRLFIELHFYRGLPAEEIAAFFKVSVSAVYTQKSRLLDRLRLALKNPDK